MIIRTIHVNRSVRRNGSERDVKLSQIHSAGTLSGSLFSTLRNEHSEELMQRSTIRNGDDNDYTRKQGYYCFNARKNHQEQLTLKSIHVHIACKQVVHQLEHAPTHTSHHHIPKQQPPHQSTSQRQAVSTTIASSIRSRIWILRPDERSIGIGIRPLRVRIISGEFL